MAEFELKALITGVDRLSPALGRMQKNLRRFRKDAEEAGQGGMAMAGGLAAGLTSSLVAFAKQEDAATGLKVAMMDAGGQVGEAFGKINDLAVRLGNKLPGTTADFQNMMQMLVRQGIPAENILSGVGEASAYLAVQLKKTPEAAAEFAAKMQDATGTASADMMGLFDTIQKAFYLGVDDSNMLSFFTKTSSVIRMVNKDGLTAAKNLAPIAVMMDQMGMEGEAAGNALRKVLQSGLAVKNVRAVNKRMKKEKLGIRLDFTDGKGGFGGLEKLFSQLKQFRKLTDVQRTDYLKKLFGDDAETLQVVNALIDKGKEGYDQILQKMEKQASLNKRVDAQLGTLANLWDALTGTAVNGLAAIGGAFSDDAKKLVNWLGDISERFTEFATKNPRVIRGAFGVAAGFVGVKLALLGVNVAMGLVARGIKMSPMGAFLRLAAIGVGLLISNWDKFGPVIERVWHKVDGVAQAIGGWETPIESISALMAGAFTLKTIGALTTATTKAGSLAAILTKISRLGAMTITIGVAIDLFNRLKDLQDAASKNGKSVGQELIDRKNAAERERGYNGFLPRLKELLNIDGSGNSAVPLASARPQQGELKVTFDNAPPGMQVAPVGNNMPWVNYDVGYNRFSKP
ncbi:phage tail tape measure protein [Escherichia coli]|uniref:phage tail tape measure protein n=1 Tax=Escherichia coli TaxID=562 RepID=UPI00106D77BC|nr:phage tail tape measure protein [Escherichia coli]VFS85743.1 bacteriophage V tail protein [Escherichia coli]HAI2337280.1 phage tail tape measure protein [Escherichia coli]